MSQPIQRHTEQAQSRRTFIRTVCYSSCLALAAGVISPFITSCSARHYVSASRSGRKLSVPLSALQDKAGKPLRYAVVSHESLDYPIALFRTGPDRFNAFVMRCTHQGHELQAAGEVLVCSAHGSEFDAEGQVRQGPADNNLKKLPVTVKSAMIEVDV